MKKKFGIIGNPIKHSLSPVLHKYWFEKYGLEASYSIIEANDNDLKNMPANRSYFNRIPSRGLQEGHILIFLSYGIV